MEIRTLWLTDEDGLRYCVVFRVGEFSRPLFILKEHEANDLARELNR